MVNVRAQQFASEMNASGQLDRKSPLSGWSASTKDRKTRAICGDLFHSPVFFCSGSGVRGVSTHERKRLIAIWSVYTLSSCGLNSCFGRAYKTLQRTNDA